MKTVAEWRAEFDELVSAAAPVSYWDMSNKELKALLASRSLDNTQCFEKSDLVRTLEEADGLKTPPPRDLDLDDSTPVHGADGGGGGGGGGGAGGEVGGGGKDMMVVDGDQANRLDSAAALFRRTSSLSREWVALRPRVGLELLVTLGGGEAPFNDLCVINATVVLFGESMATGAECFDALLNTIMDLHEANLAQRVADEGKGATDAVIAKKGSVGGPAEEAERSRDESVLVIGGCVNGTGSATLKEGPGSKAGGGDKSPCRVPLATLVKRVGKALGWWGSYYEYQNYEKRFIEYQSGIPFGEWQHMVRHLRKALREAAAARSTGP